MEFTIGLNVQNFVFTLGLHFAVPILRTLGVEATFRFTISAFTVFAMKACHQ